MLNSNRPDMPKRGWFPANHQALQALIHDLYDHRSTTVRTAVFDWDNTSVFHDVGDATFRHQLDTLTLRMPPEELASLLPERIGDCTTLHDGVSLGAVAADLRQAYAELWPSIAAGRVDQVRHGSAHRDFRAKLGYLYEAFEATPAIGAAYSYPWLLRFLRHFNETEIADLAWQAWDAAASEPIGRGSWESVSGGAAGVCRYDYATHIKLHPEMVDLFAALQECAVQVYVITASYEGIVRSVAPRLGYAVAPQHIFGMRQPNGSDYPLTYRQGKAEIVRRFLPTPPVFGAGDANTDFEMLTQFPELRVRLLIARRVQGDIRSLYRFATEKTEPGKTQTLLQGRDENLGAFHAHRETRPLGSTELLAL